MKEQDVLNLSSIVERLNNVKEQIALAMDTCCFASVDLDYDEFDLLTRELEDIVESINNIEK